MAQDLIRRPTAWTPGRLIADPPQRNSGAVVLRRELLSGTDRQTGRPRVMCTVFETICPDAYHAGVYAAQHGPPHLCPAPWGPA